MICITICVKKVGILLTFVDFCIPYFEVTLVGAFISFINFISWVHDRLMWMVHEIIHAMFERNKSRFCWCNYVSTEPHCDILKVISNLNSDAHESTNPVIYWSSMWFLNLLHLLSNERCSHEECIFKGWLHWKWWLLKFYFIFFLCSPIFLNNCFGGMICLVKSDSIFTLYYVNIEEI